MPSQPLSAMACGPQLVPFGLEQVGRPHVIGSFLACLAEASMIAGSRGAIVSP